MVRRTRRRGGAINDVDAQGRTALFKAVESNNLSKVNELIAAGADMNKVDNRGFTPLNIASLNGYLQIVDKLIKGGADINKEDNYGATPLYDASFKGHLEIVKRLIAAGANVNKARTDTGATPLYIASQNGHLEIVERLIAAGADVNASKTGTGATPLYIASTKGHLQIANRLIEAHADVNKACTDTGMTPLFAVSQNGHLEIVKQLIAAGADVNKALTDTGATPLYIASQNGHLEILKRLIAAGADVNKARTDTGETPLYIASTKGYLQIVKELLTVTGIDITVVKREMSKFIPKIQAILKTFIKTSDQLWPGFSKADSEKLGLLFEEKIHSNTLTLSPVGSQEVLYSHCPICLKYISHDEATCMYMSHNCTELGGFYHEELFNKYKHKKVNAVGIETGNDVIAWCTLCGRICKGHQHYELHYHTTKNPTLLISGAPYETDCRKTNGGGGWPEKAIRHHRLREYALYLNNKKVGTITTQEALKKLVQEMWNAPIPDKENVLEKMVAEKKYNVSNEEFPPLPYNRFPNAPNNTAYQKADLTGTTFKVGSQTFQLKNDELYTNNTTKAAAPYQYFYQQFKKGAQPIPNISYPNNTNPELKPIVHATAPAGYEDPISPDFPDTNNIVQFRHRMSDRTINNHTNPATDMIAKDSLFGMLSSALNHAELNKIGPCWKEGCTAIIYPQELKAIIDAVDYSAEAAKEAAEAGAAAIGAAEAGAAGAAKKETDMKVYEQYRDVFNKKYKGKL